MSSFDVSKLKPDADGKLWAQTRNGKRRRILCTDGPGAKPIITVTDSGVVCAYTINGRYFSGESSELDLINLPEPPREIVAWAVMSRDGNGYSLFFSRDSASIAAHDTGRTIVKLTGTYTPGE